MRLGPGSHADLLLAAPKTLQALLAATQDFYTWKLAEKTFGCRSNEAWAALALTVVSPWQWFCSTRTFSNGLETTLTIVALYFWPWHWLPDTETDPDCDERGLRKERESDHEKLSELSKLRRCLTLAGIACILRPTNILIWLPLGLSIMFRMREVGWFYSLPKLKQNILINFSYPSIRRDSQTESIALMREGVICGSAALLHPSRPP